jgi:hypothetical protein
MNGENAKHSKHSTFYRNLDLIDEGHLIFEEYIMTKNFLVKTIYQNQKLIEELKTELYLQCLKSNSLTDCLVKIENNLRENNNNNTLCKTKRNDDFDICEEEDVNCSIDLVKPTEEKLESVLNGEANIEEIKEVIRKMKQENEMYKTENMKRKKEKIEKDILIHKYIMDKMNLVNDLNNTLFNIKRVNYKQLIEYLNNREKDETIKINSIKELQAYIKSSEIQMKQMIEQEKFIFNTKGSKETIEKVKKEIKDLDNFENAPPKSKIESNFEFLLATPKK